MAFFFFISEHVNPVLNESVFTYQKLRKQNHKLPASPPACLLLRTHYRMLPASLPAYLLLRKLFRKLRQPSCSRPRSIQRCL
jgi:hypothetical protein